MRFGFAVGLTLAFSGNVQAHAMLQAVPKEAPSDIVVTGKIPDADKRVCKQTGATGSIIPKRECRTKGEWEDIRQRSIAALERLKADQQQRRNTKDALENR
jgi:hypothetical protein